VPDETTTGQSSRLHAAEIQPRVMDYPPRWLRRSRQGIRGCLGASAASRPQISLEFSMRRLESRNFSISAAPAKLWPEDVELLHELWLEISDKGRTQLHHRDVVRSHCAGCVRASIGKR